jgi:hypothetical protein
VAFFEKMFGQSQIGWDKQHSLQMLSPGGDSPIGLRGGSRPGPKGAAIDFLVSSEDKKVCTVHEIPRPIRSEYRAFRITALNEGTTRVFAKDPETLKDHARMDVEVTHGSAGIKLIFFPGEQKVKEDPADALSMPHGSIYVIGGKGERYEAVGGVKSNLGATGGHTSNITPKGLYTLGPREHVVAPSWYNSIIPWGTKLWINIDLQTHKEECVYEAKPHDWRLLTGPRGALTLARIKFEVSTLASEKKATSIGPARRKELEDEMRYTVIDPATGKLRSVQWVWNDFGQWGWNLRRKGGRTIYFVHTTPLTERPQTPGDAALLTSHGCVHIHPVDRDQMMERGYLKEGVSFEVRSYDEKGPPTLDAKPIRA